MRAAQTYYGLPADGIVGVETWRALYLAYRGILDVLPPGETERITEPYDGIPLVIGAQSDRVRLLQEYLNVIAEAYPEIPTVDETGIFGAMTEEAVMAFQQQFGLPPSGRVAATTWNAVTSIYEDIVRGNQLREGQFPGFTVQ